MFTNIEFTRDFIDGFVYGVHILYLYGLWALTYMVSMLLFGMKKLPLDVVRHTAENITKARLWLIDKILQYWHNKKFILSDKGPLTKQELYQFPVEDSLEIAIAITNPSLEWYRGKGSDFKPSDEDAKFVLSSRRQNNTIAGKEQWTHSYEVRNVKKKLGPLLVFGWNTMTQEPHMFRIPNEIFHNKIKVIGIDIENYKSSKKIKYIHDPITGDVVRTKKNGKGLKKYWQYECETFEQFVKLRQKNYKKIA